MEPSPEPQLSIRARVAHNLAAMTSSLLPHAGSLIASGGDTATALFAHAGVHSLRLLDEFEPGISLGLTAGDVSIPVVTKSGSFGDEECLLRIAHHLHMLSDT
jgi:4-hydroxythreonine-4-phosphate dehydrogenase